MNMNMLNEFNFDSELAQEGGIDLLDAIINNNVGGRMEVYSTVFSVNEDWISFFLNYPRLFIFNTAKNTPIRMEVNQMGKMDKDAPVTVTVTTEPNQFDYKWTTTLAKFNEDSRSWAIKPPRPCELIPYNFKIEVKFNDQTQEICDKFATTICKTSQFPNGLAYLLIQEKYGKQIGSDIFLKLTKKDIVKGFPIDFPDTLSKDEQEEILYKIWQSIDQKNIERNLEFQRECVRIIPSSSFLSSGRSVPFKQYIHIWDWVFNVLKFYSDNYNRFKDYFGTFPEWIDREGAEMRLNSKQSKVLLIRFSTTDPKKVGCSIYNKTKKRCEHFNFSLTSKSSTRKDSANDLIDFLTCLRNEKYKYIQRDGSEKDLSEIIQLFECFKQTNKKEEPNNRQLPFVNSNVSSLSNSNSAPASSNSSSSLLSNPKEDQFSDFLSCFNHHKQLIQNLIQRHGESDELRTLKGSLLALDNQVKLLIENKSSFIGDSTNQTNNHLINNNNLSDLNCSPFSISSTPGANLNQFNITNPNIFNTPFNFPTPPRAGPFSVSSPQLSQAQSLQYAIDSMGPSNDDKKVVNSFSKRYREPMYQYPAKVKKRI